MPATRPPAIEIAGLHKSFADNHVLRGIDLDIPSGIVFALLGANGAGKTTAISILTTLLTPDAGTVRVAGYDVVSEADKVRASVGVTGQFAAVDGLLTGEENLRLMARLAHLDAGRAKVRTAGMLEQFALTEAARKPTATYSGGMGRRLDLAMSLMLNPAIVFLDEPTTGVDPRGRAVMWDIVRGLAEQGTTIFLTTQYLEEADQLASRVAVIDGGSIIADGTPTELKRRVGSGHIVLELPTPDALAAAARMLPTATVDAEALRLRVAGSTDANTVRDTLVRLDDAQVSVANLRIVTPDLDDVFFALTGAPGQGAPRMSTASSQPFSDTMTMLWRSILHNLRAPSGVITVIGVPLIFLLLFVYVFGETLGAGLMTGGTRAEYLAYITPAILLMAAASATQMIAVWISMDMSQGIIARFRTMAIARSSVLAGHVYGGTILVTVSIAALLGFALLLGYRPQADALDWLALAGLVVLVGFALAWLSVAFGLAAKRPDTASNLPLLLMILPLLSGGFVPIESLPGWLQGIAEYQPFTPIISTIRGLLAGAPEGRDAAWAVGWSIAIAVIGYVWSLRLYRRHPAPSMTRTAGVG